MDCQEIRCDFHLGDKRQFLFQCRAHFVRDDARIAPRCALPGDILQMLLCCLSPWYWFVGIIVFELVEREFDPVGKADGFGDGAGCFVEKPRHLVRRFQVPFGIGFQKTARLVQRDMLANAGDNVLQLAPFGTVIQHIIGGQQRHACRVCYVLPFPQAAAVIAIMRHGDPKPKPSGCGAEQFFHKRLNFTKTRLRIVGIYFIR